MTSEDIVERIMTQHWDIAACCCWVCVAGYKAGYRPREKHMNRDYASVWVEDQTFPSGGILIPKDARRPR